MDSERASHGWICPDIMIVNLPRSLPGTLVSSSDSLSSEKTVLGINVSQSPHQSRSEGVCNQGGQVSIYCLFKVHSKAPHRKLIPGTS
jgi:hypothetical protein